MAVHIPSFKSPLNEALGSCQHPENRSHPADQRASQGRIMALVGAKSIQERSHLRLKIDAFLLLFFYYSQLVLKHPVKICLDNPTGPLFISEICNDHIMLQKLL